MNEDARPVHPTTARRRARKAGEPPMKRGRPPVENPARNLTIRLDATTRAQLDQAAHAAGLTVTAFVLECLARALASAE